MTEVAGWVTLPQSRAYYGANSSGFDIRPREMVRDAILALEAQGFVVSGLSGSPTGTVTGMDPAPGTAVRPGTAIALAAG